MPRKRDYQQPLLDFSAPPVEEKGPVVPPPVKFTEAVRPNGTNGHAARVRPRRGQLNLFDFNYQGEEPQPPEQTHQDDLSTPPINQTPQADSQDDGSERRVLPDIAQGEKAKALDIIAAIKTMKRCEREERPATQEEKKLLARFSGFGPVAVSIFPDPVTGKVKPGWQEIVKELDWLLQPEEMAAAKRTTFSQFFTSPIVMTAIHDAISRMGVPPNATILEPGCGVGYFMNYAPDAHFIGVELDSITARIAKLLHPNHDIRNESFADTRLPEGKIDAVVGNPPFANINMDYQGQKFALHDFFIAKSLHALKPGGILACVTSHFTLDRQNGEAREYFGSKADFLGAIRLPSDAFKREGTAVVTDIVFFRKRAPGEPARHEEAEWHRSRPVEIDGTEISMNRYFTRHPEMVLGTLSLKDTLYGEGYSVTSNGNLAEQLREAVGRLPQFKMASRPNQNGISTENPHESPSNRITIPFNLSEGSFFVNDAGTICQIEHNEAIPVVYGGTLLSSHGTMTGKRLAGLIGLRDKARAVLRTQNEGQPESTRAEARKELNWAYDRFVSIYGPVNKTTLSETKDGEQIRRMPNIVKFREDPDAMLVMSLEDYDEETGKAAKAAIFSRDVVGNKPEVTHVASAEEGLLVSLNQHGRVDLAFISQLYGKPEKEAISELGDLIYQDTESKQWQTADEFLSGNVRHKLAVAEAAGDSRNAEALRKVQPEDVLPGDIDAGLGAPWIPETDIHAFAVDLFRVAPDDVQVGHIKADASWSIQPTWSAKNSVAAMTEFGTDRANGTWLLELAMNMKAPTIYDPDPSDPDRKVINQEATLAAREKQKAIREKFKGWIFTDPDRAERLVRHYNDNFNNLRHRLFDGQHLTFPGMNEAMTLRPHQSAAVWRCMTSGNTLLAHCVGAGKTAVCCAAGMKMKQAGIIKKPMFVVMNHMLEQFAREFQQWYPNAKLLVATKEDFTKDRRKLLTAKIATGDWDGIIVTHSGFERIGMSRDYQQKFLEEQIAEYTNLIIENAASKGANRNLIKAIEKQKAAREQKLQDLMAEDKKDDGLVFDDLGVDYLFIDESAASFKNLEAATKMQRVAGIQNGGSERAFDLYMKCRYLYEKHPGHGVTFATGTPISNTLVEMYTLQRFLDPDGLRERGIDHFDAWAATFGEITENLEISPDGRTLKPRSRFSRFVNRTELRQMYRHFADVQTADMLNLPRPKLEGGKPCIVSRPMSEDQHVQQERLVERYERIRSSKVDPREDNALKITTEGRKLALDARTLDASAPPHADSKIDAMVDNITTIWKRTADKRGTQIVFSDMGVNPTPWGYSVYEEIAEKLIGDGIPREQIAVIGDADTDAKKFALFEKVRQGQVRVLIGSTSKLGTGTNVQKRLVALHHLDAPWKPSEIEQREGRILRQGNDWPEVSIFRYVTEGSFDAFMWQALETKARSFNEFLCGDNIARRGEDIGGQELSYAEVKAIASGNPAVLTLAEADAELHRLGVLKRSHADEQYIARKRLKELPGYIEEQTKRVAALTKDAETVKSQSDLIISGHRVMREDQVGVLGSALESMPTLINAARKVPLGTYRGLRFGMVLHPHFAPETYLEGATTCRDTLMREHHGPRAVLNSLERLVKEYPSEVEMARKNLTLAESQFRDFQNRHGQAFAHETYMRELTELRDQLKSGLSANPPEGTPPTAEVAEKIKALKASNTVDAPALPRAERKIDAEIPVTTRIMRQMQEGPDTQVVPETVTQAEQSRSNSL